MVVSEVMLLPLRVVVVGDDDDDPLVVGGSGSVMLLFALLPVSCDDDDDDGPLSRDAIKSNGGSEWGKKGNHWKWASWWGKLV